MNIAVIGWGSLIWDNGVLNTQREWDSSGPALPIEFTRISDDGRVTLIVDEAAKPVTTLWNLSTHADLNKARENLRVREKTILSKILSVTSYEKPNDPIKRTIHVWLQGKGIEAAIWTGLSFSVRTQNARPTVQAIIHHLRGLRGDSLLKAKEYVQKAPRQIRTDYRDAIERELGWTPI